MNAVDFYRRATEEFDRRMHGVTPTAWKAPTPCTEWDVHSLVNHVVNENRWIPPLLDGKTIDDVGDSLDGDLLGSDGYASWDDSRKQALASAEATDPNATVHVSFGDIPAEMYLSQVAFDHVIHSWDLARATGADDKIDPELVSVALEFIAPQAEMWRQGGAFGPTVTVPAGADQQGELLALTGRDPGSE